ncbi:hypothetical protein ACIQF6_36010 [Kitasatospora sp. NPDC092948]|uniref:hypothetical protein n=1 Tax=Kitasatospora sp. NPDC092948 TaxID=3364088 RepID=UPI0037F2417A
MHAPPPRPDTRTFPHEAPDRFAPDRTTDQHTAVYAAREKDALRPQPTRRLQDTGIPVLVVRGSGSQSHARLVHEHAARDPRPAVLLHVVLPGVRECGMTPH